MRKLQIEKTIFIICLIICLAIIIWSGLQVKAMQLEVKKLEYQNSRQAAQIKDKDYQIEILEIIIENRDQDASEPEYIGTFEITYYTAGPESTGKSPGHPEYGITASGTTVEEGRTIAADWSVLAPGSKVYIDGIGERIVEDTGGLIVDKCIDVYVEDVDLARQLGRHKADVWIVEDVDV